MIIPIFELQLVGYSVFVVQENRTRSGLISGRIYLGLFL